MCTSYENQTSTLNGKYYGRPATWFLNNFRNLFLSLQFLTAIGIIFQTFVPIWHKLNPARTVGLISKENYELWDVG